MGSPIQQPFRNLEDVISFERISEETWLTPKTIYNAFCKVAETYSTKDALIVQPFGDVLGEGLHISYGDLLKRVNQTANMFLAAGLQTDETVTQLLPQSAYGFYTLLGAEAVGIVNAVNPMLEANHILGIMKAANSRILVIPGSDLSPEIWQKAMFIKEAFPKLKAIFVVGDGAGCDGRNFISFDTAMAKQDATKIVNLPDRGLDDVVGYYHTGGTTGVPKLVPHTNRMQLIQLASTGFLIGYSAADIMIGGLPLFHISGSIVGGLVPLSQGATIIIASPLGWRDQSLVRNYWKTVEKFKVTILGTVPTVLSALLNIPVEGADISSLRIGITGGAGSPLEVLHAITEISGVPMLEGYGMTEVTSYTTLMPRDGELRFGSVGLREPYAEIMTMILDEDGAFVRDADPDETGVIVMRGTCAMRGYVQQEHNAKAFVVDNWLNSGDLGRIDAQGYIWLTGRSKDLIIRSGHNIDPTLIEEPLHEHPAVELAAAIGKPDSYAGEMPIAYVQLKSGQNATSDELQEFARSRIKERAANPAEIILLDEMPLTGVGKIFKPALREYAAQRVFDMVLEDLKSPENLIEVKIVHEARTGMTALVTVSANTTNDVRAEIKRRLGAYTVHHEIRN